MTKAVCLGNKREFRFFVIGVLELNIKKTEWNKLKNYLMNLFEMKAHCMLQDFVFWVV